MKYDKMSKSFTDFLLFSIIIAHCLNSLLSVARFCKNAEDQMAS